MKKLLFILLFVSLPCCQLSCAAEKKAKTDTESNLKYEFGGLDDFAIQEMLKYVPDEKLGSLIAQSKRLQKLAEPELATRKQRALFKSKIGAQSILNLSSSKITELPSNIFNDPTFYTVKNIFLSRNELEKLPTEIFENMNNVETIFLDNNKLKSIMPDTFSNLASLEKIHLSENQLTHLQENTFKDLPNLTTIGLANNKIETIELNTFNHLPKLDIIYLENNQLKDIDPEVFDNLPMLKSITLKMNPLTDKTKKALVEKFRNTNVKFHF